MKIVIDTSAVIAVLLDEETHHSIISSTSGFEIVSAASLPWEVGNSMIANLRKKRLNKEEAVLAIKNFELMDIRLIEVNLEKSILLANQLGIYAYDAYILSCAQTLKVPLLTLDNLMIRMATEIGIKTMEV